MLDFAGPVVFRIVRPWSAPCRRVGAPDPARPAVPGTRRTCKAKHSVWFERWHSTFREAELNPVMPLSDPQLLCENLSS